MNICMPTTEDNGMTSKVYGHFGSAPFFAFYNTETKELEVIDNSNQHHEHGACNPIGQMEGRNVGIVITGGMGKGAIMKLNLGNIKVYMLDGTTVEDAVQNFMSGQLKEISPQGACAGHGCH